MTIETYLIWLSALFLTISLSIITVLLWSYIRNGQVINTTSPKPFKLKIIWPLVSLVERFLTLFPDVIWVRWYQSKLIQSGLQVMISPIQFVALKIVLVLLIALFTSSMLDHLQIAHWSTGVAIGAIGIILPDLWLKNETKARQQLIVRDLPNFLEYLQISMVAGLNLTGALNQAVKKGPSGALKNELIRVVRDIRTGQSRIQALKNSAERVSIKDYHTLVQAIIQSELSGSSLGNTLKSQAEQRRTERFLSAEKSALEAPVKLLFPLVMFIFPVSFLILSFPVLIKFMYGF